MDKPTGALWNQLSPRGQAHSLRVAEILEPHGATLFPRRREALRYAALYHDVLEDVPDATLAALQDELGPDIDDDAAYWVLLVTGGGRNRRERQESIRRNLSTRPPHLPEAHLVKLADRLDNVRSAAGLVTGEAARPDLLAMYRKEHDHWRTAFLMPPLADLLAAVDEVILG